MGMYVSTKAKEDSEEQDKEGRRKLALIQHRPNQQLHKMVSNFCEFYKLWHFVAHTEYVDTQERIRSAIGRDL